MSTFSALEVLPPDPNFDAVMGAKLDDHPDKTDLTIGVYRDGHGRPQMFKAVRMAKISIVNDPNEYEEYLPLMGHELFANEAAHLVFRFDEYTEEQYSELRNRTLSQHVISGTGALFNALSVLRRCTPNGTVVYASDPCWVAYKQIVERCGYVYGEYPYYNYVDNTVNIEELLKAFESYPKDTIVILQTSCHNPTGLDLSDEQWLMIIDVLKRRGIIPLLDSAYQGFATNDFKKDAGPIKLFCDAHMDFLLAQSFSKIMSIYSTRTGVLHVVMREAESLLHKKVLTNLKQLGRSCYSNPPRHGAEIAYRLLSNPELRSAWEEEFTSIVARIMRMRRLLYEGLKERKVPGDWEHLAKQRGMFAFLNIPREKVLRLRDEHHVHLISNSRVCVAGLNDAKVKHVVDALYSVLTT